MPDFHQVVTRSWDRTIKTCVDLLLKDLGGFMAILSCFISLNLPGSDKGRGSG